MPSSSSGHSCFRRVREASEKVRIVASKKASSGITFATVPAWTRPTLTTTGSKMLNRLVTMAWVAVIISAIAGTGSAARCGAEPCPPRPITRTLISSVLAITGPGLVEKVPRGSRPAHT